MTDVGKFNNQSVGEEIGNAVTHGIGALLAIAGTTILIIRACFYSDAMGIVSASIYGFTMILLYTFSTLYHSLTSYKAKRVFQVFDHCTIFLLILGTYTPICLNVLRGAWGWVLFGINAGCTVIGIVFNCIDLKKWHKASLVLYIIMGWSIVMAVKPAINSIPWQGLLYILAGGIAYTAGVIFYKSTKKYMHFVWHFFVLAGSILQYFGILFYCFPKI